ncbi:hypothetical protein P4114_25200 [Pseudomonas aeruginosa]|nr:hypothetical protein [Pseudomonas aeruginosa]
MPPGSLGVGPGARTSEFFATEAAEPPAIGPAGAPPAAAEQRTERVAGLRMMNGGDAAGTGRRRLGMRSFHFHRLFKAETGLTPKATRLGLSL